MGLLADLFDKNPGIARWRNAQTQNRVAGVNPDGTLDQRMNIIGLLEQRAREQQAYQTNPPSETWDIISSMLRGMGPPPGPGGLR